MFPELKYYALMLKIIKLPLAILLLCISCFVVSAQTQKEYAAELKKYMKASGSDASFKMVTDNMSNIVQMPGMSEEQINKFTKLLVDSYDNLIELMVPAYQKNLSIEDLKAAVAFYNTPAGKRLAEAQPKIAMEAASAAQQWALGFQHSMKDIMEPAQNDAPAQ